VPRPRRAAKQRLTAAYERRNERARAKGYKSYYDYRAHNQGKLPPSAPRASGAALRRLRGHASRADLISGLREDTLIVAAGYERDAAGRFKQLDLQLVDERGRTSEFTLRGRQLDGPAMRKLVATMLATGAVVDPYLQRLAGEELEEREAA
jgi:hypothetical protein